eukprot:TRINITY_DN697_c0_g1_i5.p1 TRINITY_DN697_c0_g1~~TRINITY_DN697_c0_g1_i5.p1  ORF type:complete len:872 (+),score=313.06 TRINITY_DN697_c0_g1_i5:125-2740(+)
MIFNKLVPGASADSIHGICDVVPPEPIVTSLGPSFTSSNIEAHPVSEFDSLNCSEVFMKKLMQSKYKCHTYEPDYHILSLPFNVEATVKGFTKLNQVMAVILDKSQHCNGESHIASIANLAGIITRNLEVLHPHTMKSFENGNQIFKELIANFERLLEISALVEAKIVAEFVKVLFAVSPSTESTWKLVLCCLTAKMTLPSDVSVCALLPSSDTTTEKRSESNEIIAEVIDDWLLQAIHNPIQGETGQKLPLFSQFILKVISTTLEVRVSIETESEDGEKEWIDSLKLKWENYKSLSLTLCRVVLKFGCGVMASALKTPEKFKCFFTNEAFATVVLPVICLLEDLYLPELAPLMVLFVRLIHRMAADGKAKILLSETNAILKEDYVNYFKTEEYKKEWETIPFETKNIPARVVTRPLKMFELAADVVQSGLLGKAFAILASRPLEMLAKAAGLVLSPLQNLSLPSFTRVAASSSTNVPSKKKVETKKDDDKDDESDATIEETDTEADAYGIGGLFATSSDSESESDASFTLFHSDSSDSEPRRAARPRRNSNDNNDDDDDSDDDDSDNMFGGLFDSETEDEPKPKKKKKKEKKPEPVDTTPKTVKKDVYMMASEWGSPFLDTESDLFIQTFSMGLNRFGQNAFFGFCMNPDTNIIEAINNEKDFSEFVDSSSMKSLFGILIRGNVYEPVIDGVITHMECPRTTVFKFVLNSETGMITAVFEDKRVIINPSNPINKTSIKMICVVDSENVKLTHEHETVDEALTCSRRSLPHFVSLHTMATAVLGKWLSFLNAGRDLEIDHVTKTEIKALKQSDCKDEAEYNEKKKKLENQLELQLWLSNDLFRFGHLIENGEETHDDVLACSSVEIEVKKM